MLQFHEWPHEGSSIQTNQKLRPLGLGCDHKSGKDLEIPSSVLQMKTGMPGAPLRQSLISPLQPLQHSGDPEDGGYLWACRGWG